MNEHDYDNGFLREVRVEPLTGDEVRILGYLLTKQEFETIILMQDHQWVQSFGAAIGDERAKRSPK